MKTPIREPSCRWCAKKLEHPKSAGRPRVYCGPSCANEHHNWERRRERRLEAGLSPDQADIFGALPLAASNGRRPPRPRLTRARRINIVDASEAAHG